MQMTDVKAGCPMASGTTLYEQCATCHALIVHTCQRFSFFARRAAIDSVLRSLPIDGPTDYGSSTLRSDLRARRRESDGR